jgi:uncharacterized membrane protein YjjP (DUF1212 family)
MQTVASELNLLFDFRFLASYTTSILFLSLADNKQVLITKYKTKEREVDLHKLTRSSELYKRAKAVHSYSDFNLRKKKTH